MCSTVPTDISNHQLPLEGYRADPGSLLRHGGLRYRKVQIREVVVLAALMTPPFQLVLSHTDRPESLALVVADLQTAPDAVPGVLAPSDLAALFVRDWSTSTGQASQLTRAERICRLDTVRTVASASGRLRPLAPADHARTVAWLTAFHEEALPDEPQEDITDLAERILTATDRRLYVWDDLGPTSPVGAAGPTPNGIRIGPVYTPPLYRKRGYATAAVATLSRLLLDEGCRFCFLFTDRSNPTSNHIYQEIGYVPVCDVDHYSFRNVVPIMSEATQ
jgi:uncharacterized protein